MNSQKSTASGNATSPAGQNRTTWDEKSEGWQNWRLILIWAGVFLGVGLLALHLFAGIHFSRYFMVALSTWAVGALIGMLFGFPKSRAGQGYPDEPNIRYQENNALEEISDWLVKLLLGASLAQAGHIMDLVKKVASITAMGTLPAGAGPDDPDYQAAYVFTCAMILYFVIAGFVTGYMAARVLFPGMFLAAQRGLMEGLQQKVKEMSSKMNTMSELWNSDPHKGQFGGKAERDGYTLSAKVNPIRHSQGYPVELRLRAPENTEFPAACRVHLHPTFLEPTRLVSSRNNEWTHEFPAIEAFTVGVEVLLGTGATVRLELDLAELPGIPAQFINASPEAAKA